MFLKNILFILAFLPIMAFGQGEVFNLYSLTKDGHGSATPIKCGNGYLLAVTNKHVVDVLQKGRAQFSYKNGIGSLDFKKVYVSKENDIAFIKIDLGKLDEKFCKSKIFDYKKLGGGIDSEVISVTVDFDKDKIYQDEEEGIVLRGDDIDGRQVIITDTEIHKGDSGSALINLDEGLVGICSGSVITELKKKKKKEEFMFVFIDLVLEDLKKYENKKNQKSVFDKAFFGK